MAHGVKMKPTSVIKAHLGIQHNGPVQAFFTKTCADHMDKYVPYRNGELAYTTRTIEKNQIVYSAPYAHYMYEGKVMGPNVPIKENGLVTGWFSPQKPKNYTGKDITYQPSAGHEYAGPRWDKRMWSAEKDDVLKEVQNFVDKHGGKK